MWLLNGGMEGDVAGACRETKKLMEDFSKSGRYELNAKAKERLFADFEGGVATPEETEAQMRRTKEESGYILDPHTAVAVDVAKKLGYPKIGRKVVIAATATPYKFPETCRKAFGEDVLSCPPPSFRNLEILPVVQTKVVDLGGIDDAVKNLIQR